MDTNLGKVVLVKDIYPGITDDWRQSPYSSYPRYLAALKDKLYFSANDGETGEELWVSDGTAKGTESLINVRVGYKGFTEFKDKLYFSPNDGGTRQELWVSDGTAKGTELVVDLTPGTSEYNYAYSSDITKYNGKLYFTADDGETGQELWVSDGTAKGTELVVDLTPGISEYNYAYSSDITNLTEYNGKLYFTADDGETGQELWVSDGTAKGTELVVDLTPGISKYGRASSSDITNLTVYNGKLYFAADDGKTGQELWVSDGTAKGSELLVDINPDGSSSPYGLTEYNDKLYFTANDGETGSELWVSDGTAKGTKLFVDINTGTDISYGMDGSAGEIYVYPASSSPSDFVEFDQRLYFSADDGENGRELWVSDGTTQGTSLVANINPEISRFGNDKSSNPRDLTVVGDELFFSADNGETGTELFKLSVSNSTDLETVRLTNNDDILDGDINPNTLDGGPGNDVLRGKTANDNLIGGTGNDDLIGGTGNDNLIGESGHDNLIGGSGHDNLIGGFGNDRLVGGFGNDLLIGGGGVDIFILEIGKGKDIIVDFAQDFNGGDRFVLPRGTEFSQLSFTKDSIKVGDETLATLVDFDAESLTPIDFNVTF